MNTQLLSAICDVLEELSREEITQSQNTDNEANKLLCCGKAEGFRSAADFIRNIIGASKP